MAASHLFEGALRAYVQKSFIAGFVNSSSLGDLLTFEILF